MGLKNGVQVSGCCDLVTADGEPIRTGTLVIIEVYLNQTAVEVIVKREVFLFETHNYRNNVGLYNKGPLPDLEMLQSFYRNTYVLVFE